MTPVEKAKDLINQYLHLTLNVESDKDINIFTAKECSLIAVDEILKVAFYSADEIYNYYIEVKEEIERL